MGTESGIEDHPSPVGFARGCAVAAHAVVELPHIAAAFGQTDAVFHRIAAAAVLGASALVQYKLAGCDRNSAAFARKIVVGCEQTQHAAGVLGCKSHSVCFLQ